MFFRRLFGGVFVVTFVVGLIMELRKKFQGILLIAFLADSSFFLTIPRIVELLKLK